MSTSNHFQRALSIPFAHYNTSRVPQHNPQYSHPPRLPRPDHPPPRSLHAAHLLGCRVAPSRVPPLRAMVGWVERRLGRGLGGAVGCLFATCVDGVHMSSHGPMCTSR